MESAVRKLASATFLFRANGRFARRTNKSSSHHSHFSPRLRPDRHGRRRTASSSSSSADAASATTTNTAAGSEALVPPVKHASKFKGPIVNQLWDLRQAAKREATESGRAAVDADRPRPPSESTTKIVYGFEDDDFLRERYRNPFGTLRFGKVLEDLDALAGNIAYGHVQDPAVNIVTASVDRIRLSGTVGLHQNQELSGKVTYVGTSSMEIRMQCRGDGEDDPWMEAYFTFVAMDPDTRRPTKLPPLDPQTWLETDQFEAGKRRAQLRKEARKKQKHYDTPLVDEDTEAAATGLLREAGPLKLLPSLACPRSILVEQTRQQNFEVAQPQTANLNNQIFGGFLMRRAFDLAFATVYVFLGSRPRFVEVDTVAFTTPVGVGDLTNFRAEVICAAVGDEPTHLGGRKGAPLVSVEVSAWIVAPEEAAAKLSNKFVYTFAGEPGRDIRRVLPSNMEEARRMAIQLAKQSGTA
mmetsp:Transcript_6414/g.15879  ORF Transcript_6414/g.15879 Transcript_6414/m.15879 type:complete len:469 (-) Transcript_6414:176-1582(-)